MVDEIVVKLQMAYKHVPFDIIIKDLPGIYGDRVMINQVFNQPALQCH